MPAPPRRPRHPQPLRGRPSPLQLRRPRQNGRVGKAFHKSLLPTYDVFDEDRYFEPYRGVQILELGGRKLGISICEERLERP